MARIDWVVMCDHAFLDRQDRLAVIGIVRQFSAARLPLALNQVMLVARLVDIQQVDEIAISVAVLTPGGCCISPTSSYCLAIEMAGEYMLITLRELPLREQDTYRFQVAVGEQSAVSLDIPVVAVDRTDIAITH